MTKIHYFREGKFVVEEEKQEEYSEYKLDIIHIESFKTFFATIEEIITEPRWIPKSVVDPETKLIKQWFIDKKEKELKDFMRQKKQSGLEDFM